MLKRHRRRLQKVNPLCPHQTHRLLSLRPLRKEVVGVEELVEVEVTLVTAPTLCPAAATVTTALGMVPWKVRCDIASRIG